MCSVEPYTARVISVNSTEPITPKMEVMNAYFMPGISTMMDCWAALASVMSKPDRPCARPISVPKKPSDTSRLGTASAKAERPGPWMTVSSLMKSSTLEALWYSPSAKNRLFR